MRCGRQGGNTSFQGGVWEALSLNILAEKNLPHTHNPSIEISCVFAFRELQEFNYRLVNHMLKSYIYNIGVKSCLEIYIGIILNYIYEEWGHRLINPHLL